jgi:hypothetical protein
MVLQHTAVRERRASLKRIEAEEEAEDEPAAPPFLGTRPRVTDHTPCYTLARPYNQPRRLETLVGSTPGVRVRNFRGGVLATQPLTLARCGVSLPRLPPGLALLCCAWYGSAWRHADRGSSPTLRWLLTQRLPAGSEWRVEPRSSAHHLGSCGDKRMSHTRRYCIHAGDAASIVARGGWQQTKRSVA